MIGGVSNVVKRIMDHISLVEKTLNAFYEVLKQYLKEETDIDELAGLMKLVHDLEGQADDVQDEATEVIMVSRLLPETKVELLRLVDRIDGVANKAESIIDHVFLFAHLKFPRDMRGQILDMMEVTLKQMKSAKEMVKLLFEDFRKAKEKVAEVDDHESYVDGVERKLISELRKWDVSIAEKYVYLNFIEKLADISDALEDVASLVEQIIAVRQI